MSWYTVAATGASRHLWFHVTGDGAPTYGRWISPSGHDVRKVLGERGPVGLDVSVHWIQAPEHYGKQRTDILWQTGPLGLKLVSDRMRRILEDHGARLETFEDVEIRLRDGDLLTGYAGVLEETQAAGPVHSLWRGRRSHRLVVSEEVRDAIKHARLTGIEIEPVDGPFPADRPGFFDE